MESRPIHPLNMAYQAGKIKSIFPGSSISFTPTELIWKCTITPTSLSASYDVKLIYTKGLQPNVYVINPKLSLYTGKTVLPHVYDTEKQWLCLYYKKAKEWKSSMLIADTVIPWTCEWLLHYECWLATGVWHGGGIHHTLGKKKIN